MKKQKQIPTQETVETPTDWVINCSKCGAALTVKNDGKAYICAVCGTVFRVQKQEKKVEIAPKEKKVQLTLSEDAVKLLTKKPAKKITNPARLSKKTKKALKVLLQNNVVLTDYDTADSLEISADGKKIQVK